MDLFHRNLEKWSLINPEDREIIDRLENLKPPFSVEFCSTAAGVFNLRRKTPEVEGGFSYLHSQDDPQAEAREWFSSLDVGRIETVYVYGIGLGYYYEPAVVWLKENPESYLVFLEDDPEVMRCFLETERAWEMLENPQVMLCLIGTRQEQVGQFSRLTSLFPSPKFLFTALKCYENEKKLSYSEYKSTFSFLTSMNAMIHAEMHMHGIAFFRNFFYNYLELPRSYFANGLFSKFQGIPAIICGAGPSLNKNVDVLSTLYDRALIFAGGTALNALNGKGVMPHFGCGIDPNSDQFTRLVMNHAFELPFLYRCRMLHEALEMVHGDKLFISGSGGYEVGKWFEKKLGVDELELEEGFNVLNFSVNLARAMGCDPIICVGIDLAYSGGDSYAAGVVSHPIHNRKSNFRTKTMDDELITKLDIFGNPVLTLWKWIAESLWYTDFANSQPDCTLINATEGGIGFIQVPNMTLQEVKEKYLNRQIDLKGRLHGEIQNSPLPQSFNETGIVAIMRSLIDSLSRCGDICQRLLTEYANRIEEHSIETAPSETIMEGKRQLMDEEAYGVILKNFDEGRLKIKKLVLKRLEADKDSLSKEEYSRRKAVLDLEHTHSLKETAFLNTDIVLRMLDQRGKKKERLNTSAQESEIKKLCRQYPVPVPKPDEVYFLDEKSYKIRDPELELEYEEALSPEKPLRKESLFYPSGNVKFVEYYFGDALHGPSTFYAENGSILSRAWFIHGKRVGKAWTYYLEGSLHSLQRFENDLAIGMHQYFYPDGIPKSILPYKQGSLHGEVHLYDCFGTLVRHLSFVDGKRTGVEQIWNDEGQLVIESQYDGDRPVGTARTWHSNGVLAHEFIYDDDSRRIVAREWDPQGVLIEGGESHDYFDQMNKEADKLTASLSDMVVTMSQIAPLVTEEFLFKAPPPVEGGVQQNVQADLTAELAKLKEEMERLQEIDHRLKEQLADQEDDSNEAIWKTPTSRQYLEKQFEAKKDQMNEDIEKIQHNLKAVIQSLLDKGKNDPKS